MVSEADIAEFGDLWSLMYYVFAREMVDRFGEEGGRPSSVPSRPTGGREASD